MVTRQNGYRGPNFRSTRGTKQEGLTSPKLFNMAVESVVSNCLSPKVEDKAVIQDGLGHVIVRILGVSYEGDGLLGSRDPEGIQGELNVLIVLLLQIRLAANITKLNTTT